MCCEEVKRLLDEFTVDEQKLKEHIKNCPECALDFEAQQLLKSAFENNRNEKLGDETPFELVKTRLENQIATLNTKESNFMTKVKKQIKTHPKASFGITVAVTLFAFMLLVPFSYDRTVGYDVILAGFEGGQIEPEVINDVSIALGFDDIVLELTIDNELILSHFPSERAAKEVADAISIITKIDNPVRIKPIRQVVSGSLFAQARDKLLKIEVDTKGKTDEEVETEIRKILKERGATEADVDVSTDDEGMREIIVHVKDSSDTKQTEKKMKIMVSGDEKISIDDPACNIQVETEGKTVEEIEAEIKKQMKEKGIKDAEIDVTLEDDGKKRIEIKVEKDSIDCDM
jgi:hypothetical protein